MEAIVRYIFRFDYKPCFDLLNRPGDALKILTAAVDEKYWDNVGVNRDRLGVSVAKEDGNAGTAQTFAFEHNNLNGVFRAEAGIDTDRLLGNTSLAMFDSLAKELMPAFLAIPHKFGCLRRIRCDSRRLH